MDRRVGEEKLHRLSFPFFKKRNYVGKIRDPMMGMQKNGQDRKKNRYHWTLNYRSPVKSPINSATSFSRPQ